MAHGEHELPGKRHQLVIAETRQRAANPDEDEQQEARSSPRTRTAAADTAAATGTSEHAAPIQMNTMPNTGKRNAVERPRGMQAVIKRRSAPANDEQQRRARSHEPYSVGKQRMPAAEEQRSSPSAVTVIMLAYSAMKNAANFMTAVLGVETRHQFVLRFRQIERDAVGFRERGDQEDDEADDLRKRALEDRPARHESEVEAVLRVDDFAQAERVRHQQRGGMASAIGSS